MQFPKHDGGLTLEHNPNRSGYQAAADWFTDMEDLNIVDADSVTDEDRAACIAQDSIWELRWYPDTPIGFHVIIAPNLERIEQLLAERGFVAAEAEA